MIRTPKGPDHDVRLAWLVDTLRREVALTYDEIAARWLLSPLNEGGEQLPLRTFHHHRRRVRETLGVDIVCDPGSGWRYSIARRSLPEAVERLVDARLGAALAAAGASMEPVAQTLGHEHVAALAEAMLLRRPVTLVYRAPRRPGRPRKEPAVPETITADIEPYHLREWGGDWWAIGRNLASLDTEAFCLGDLSELTVRHDLPAYKLPPSFDADMWLRGCAGMLREEEVERVVARVRYDARRRIAAHPLHPSQREIARDDQSVTYEYRVRPNYDFVQRLMMWTDQIEVLAPQTLRDELNRIAFRLIDFYNRGR